MSDRITDAEIEKILGQFAFPGKPDVYGAITQLQADLAAMTAERDALRAALVPFAFLGSATAQEAWEIRYRDRFEDWIDFSDIEAARAALGAS